MKKKLVLTALAVCVFYISASAGIILQVDTPVSKGTIFVKKSAVDTSISLRLKKGSKYQITIAPVKQDPNANPWYKRITIVQAFDNATDKAAAATGSLVFPKDSASTANFAFAVGVNVLNNGAAYGAAQLNPFFAWQKNTQAAKKQDVITSGLNFQMLLPKFTSDGIFQFYTIDALNYKNDRVKASEGTQASIYLEPSFYGRGGDFYFLPDAQMKNDAIEIIYDLFGGLEYENTAMAKSALDVGDVSRLYGRINATISPLPKLLDERLQFVPDYTVRYGFSKTIANEQTTNKLWKYSVNLILVKQATSKFGDISIGYDHQTGVDPTVGFQNQTVGTLSIKIKVTPGAVSK